MEQRFTTDVKERHLKHELLAALTAIYSETPAIGSETNSCRLCPTLFAAGTVDSIALKKNSELLLSEKACSRIRMPADVVAMQTVKKKRTPGPRGAAYGF